MSSPTPTRSISESRRATYYLGLALMAVGFLSFVSVFITGALHFGESGARSPMWRALLGMGLIVAGRLLRSVGSRGLAGSGLVLDPERARRDVEPWSRMAGGVVKDALEEAGVDLHTAAHPGPPAREADFDDKLRRLHELQRDGILSREEYEREKQQILDRI